MIDQSEKVEKMKKNIPTTVKNKKLVEKRREQIIIAAIKLFSQKGFHKTTLRELSEEAGLSYGNIYDYVGSKEDIFSLIHDYAANLTMKAVRESIENVIDPVEKLRRIVHAEFNLMNQLPDAIMLIYQESHILSKPFLHRLLKKEREHLELFEQVIKECIDSGQLRPCNVRIAANFIKAMIDAWIIKRWDLRGFGNSLEAERFILQFIFSGLLPEQSLLRNKTHRSSLSINNLTNGLKGQTALIINADTPIGSALCDNLHAQGMALTVFTEKYPAVSTRENPINSCNESVGVANYSRLKDGPMTVDLYQKIEKQMGHIDFLILDLGASTLSLRNNEKTSKGNLMQENLRTAEVLADFLQSRKTINSPKRLIFIAPWHWDQFADSIRYQTSKAAIISLTKCLSDKIASKGINVNCIVAGYLRSTRPSELEKQYGDQLLEKIPAGNIGEISDVIEAILFLCRDTARYITGQVIQVSGGLA